VTLVDVEFLFLEFSCFDFLTTNKYILVASTFVTPAFPLRLFFFLTIFFNTSRLLKNFSQRVLFRCFAIRLFYFKIFFFSVRVSVVTLLFFYFCRSLHEVFPFALFLFTCTVFCFLAAGSLYCFPPATHTCARFPFLLIFSGVSLRFGLSMRDVFFFFEESPSSTNFFLRWYLTVNQRKGTTGRWSCTPHPSGCFDLVACLVAFRVVGFLVEFFNVLLPLFSVVCNSTRN